MPVTRARAKGNGEAPETVSPPKTQAGAPNKPLTRAMSKKQFPATTASSPPRKNKNSGSSESETAVENVRPKRLARIKTVELTGEEPKPPKKRATRQKKVKPTADVDAKSAEEIRVQQLTKFTNLLKPEASWHKKVTDTIIDVEFSLAAKKRAAKEMLANTKANWANANGRVVAADPTPLLRRVKAGDSGQTQNGYEHEGVNGNADVHREMTPTRRQPGRSVKKITVAATNSEMSTNLEGSVVEAESVQGVDQNHVDTTPAEDGELKTGTKRQRDLSADKPELPQHQFQLVIPDSFNFGYMNNAPMLPGQPMKKLHLEFNQITPQEIQVTEEVLTNKSVTVEESGESKENKPQEVNEEVICPTPTEINDVGTLTSSGSQSSRLTYCFTPPAPVTVKKKLPPSQLVTTSVTEIVQATRSRRETFEVISNKEMEPSYNSDSTTVIQEIQPDQRKTFDVVKSKELSSHSELTKDVANDTEATSSQTHASDLPSEIEIQIPSVKTKEKLSVTYTVNNPVEISYQISLSETDDDESFVDANSTLAGVSGSGNNNTVTFNTPYETAYEEQMSLTRDNETIAWLGDATKCQTLYPVDDLSSEDDESVEMEFGHNPGPSSLVEKPIRNSMALYKKLLSEPVRDINESLFVAGELEENEDEGSTGQPKPTNETSGFDESNNYEISHLEEILDEKQVHRLNKKIPLWATDGAHLQGQLYLSNPILLQQVMGESEPEEFELTDDEDEEAGEIKKVVDVSFPPCNTYFKLFPGALPPLPRK